MKHCPTCTCEEPTKLIYPIDKIYVTQNFGAWPEHYRRYGLPGHNGVDFRTKFVDSPLGRRYVTASADGKIEIVRADANGYGTYQTEHSRRRPYYLRTSNKGLYLQGRYRKSR